MALVSHGIHQEQERFRRERRHREEHVLCAPPDAPEYFLAEGPQTGEPGRQAAERACITGDRDAAQRLLAEEFVPSSPQDDHIGKTEFLERCFPAADRLKSQEILQLVSAGEDDVFIMYEYELKTGERHRNTEFITVSDGQLIETQVFFGGQAH